MPLLLLARHVQLAARTRSRRRCLADATCFRPRAHQPRRPIPSPHSRPTATARRCQTQLARPRSQYPQPTRVPTSSTAQPTLSPGLPSSRSLPNPSPPPPSAASGRHDRARPRRRLPTPRCPRTARSSRAAPRPRPARCARQPLHPGG